MGRYYHFHQFRAMKPGSNRVDVVDLPGCKLFALIHSKRLFLPDFFQGFHIQSGLWH